MFDKAKKRQRSDILSRHGRMSHASREFSASATIACMILALATAFGCLFLFASIISFFQ